MGPSVEQTASVKMRMKFIIKFLRPHIEPPAFFVFFYRTTILTEINAQFIIFVKNAFISAIRRSIKFKNRGKEERVN